MTDASPIVAQYEVFKNDRNALAFFFYRHPVLDNVPEEGPYWFTINEDDSIQAGAEASQVVFEKVLPEILDIARQRGVIMLTEFENQQPIRCTPCYLAETF